MRGPITHLLSRANLSAAQRFADQVRTAQAARETERFLDRLDDVPANSYISPAAEAALQEEAHAALDGMS